MTNRISLVSTHLQRIPHVYTTPSCPDAARCWVPCIDNLWEKCTWEFEFVVPRYLEEADERDEFDTNEPSPTIVLCSGELVEQVCAFRFGLGIVLDGVARSRTHTTRTKRYFSSLKLYQPRFSISLLLLAPSTTIQYLPTPQQMRRLVHLNLSCMRSACLDRSLSSRPRLPSYGLR